MLIIDLVHRFGLKVAAEGFEDIETFDMLKNGGCDIMQGYLFGHPMPASSFRDLLDNHDPGAMSIPPERAPRTAADPISIHRRILLDGIIASAMTTIGSGAGHIVQAVFTRTPLDWA